MAEVADEGPPGTLPPWRRRNVLITGMVIVAAAVAAAVVLWPGSQSREYTTVPPPCTLVTAATLGRYLPGATSAPLGPSVPGGCHWLSTSGRQGQRELTVVAAVFGSPSGVAEAKKDFELNARGTLQTPNHEITFTVTRQSVPGLGDQAAAQILQPGKNAIPPTPVIVVDVRSVNAALVVTLNVDQAGSARLPTGPQLLSDAVAVARDVLAVLAHAGR
jgi:hypothetical protein